MTDDDAAAVKEMIDTLEGAIDTARARSYSFVTHLLEMARLELLMQYHGIQECELDTFCEALTQKSASQHDRRAVIVGNASPRRTRRGRIKGRSARRSSGPLPS